MSGLLLQGSFAGPESRCSALRSQVIAVANRAVSVGALLDELERLAQTSAFALETQPIRDNELVFYFWAEEAEVAAVADRS